jgi:hypothetical protein
MRRTNRNARPYFLIPVGASQEESFRRWNRVLMLMLGLLVVGLLLISFVPEGNQLTAGNHSVAHETAR